MGPSNLGLAYVFFLYKKKTVGKAPIVYIYKRGEEYTPRYLQRVKNREKFGAVWIATLSYRSISSLRWTEQWMKEYIWWRWQPTPIALHTWLLLPAIASATKAAWNGTTRVWLTAHVSTCSTSRCVLQFQPLAFASQGCDEYSVICCNHRPSSKTKQNIHGQETQHFQLKKHKNVGGILTIITWLKYTTSLDVVCERYRFLFLFFPFVQGFPRGGFLYWVPSVSRRFPTGFLLFLFFLSSLFFIFNTNKSETICKF